MLGKALDDRESQVKEGVDTIPVRHVYFFTLLGLVM